MKLNTIVTALILLLIAIYIPRTRYAPGTSDAYWHMAVGRQVWEQKTIPSSDSFVFGYQNTSYISTEWLSGLLYYFSTLSPLGLDTLYIIRTIIALLTIILLKKTLDLVSNNQLLRISVLTATAYLLGFRFATDRPELLSYLFLALTNYVCFVFYKNEKVSKLAWVLPLIYLAWPNIHAFGVIGVATILLFICAALLKKPRINKKSLATFIIICTASILLSVLQLKRFLSFLLINHAAPFNIKELASLPGRLSEIKYSPLAQTPPEAYIFFIVVILYIAFLLPEIKATFKNKNYSRLLVNLFFFAVILVPFKYFRLITPCVLLALPNLLAITNVQTKKSNLVSYISLPVLTLSALLIASSAVLGFPIGDRNSWQYIANLDKNNEIVGVRNRSWTDNFPYKTNKFIKENLQAKRLFTSNPWRSYYLWYFPQIKVPSDAIFEYQTLEGFQKEEDVRFGKGDWQKTLEEYQVDVVVNSPIESNFTSLTPVYTLPGWKLVYIDEIATIYTKPSAIINLPLDLSKIEPQLTAPLKFKKENEKEALQQLEKLLDFDNKNLFARQQLILTSFEQKNYQKALDLASVGHNIAPKFPYFNLYLARANALLGNCPSARAWAQEAKTISSNDIIITDMANNTLLGC